MNKKKEKTKQCGLCRLPIFLDKDNYCRLTDFFEGKFYAENFYHTKCYVDKLKNKNEMDAMKKAAWNLLKKANSQIGNSGMEVEL